MPTPSPDDLLIASQPKHKSFFKRFSIVFKVLTIFFMTLGLLIPLMMVEGIIYEREDTQNDVIESIAATWSGPQQIIGLILSVPYKQKILVSLKDNDTEKSKQEWQTVDNTFFLLPEQYTVTSTIQPEIRYRGIYQAVVYTNYA